MIAEVALAIVAELERCAALALRCRQPRIAGADPAVAHATALADENRRLRKRLRELTADKAILQLILKRAR